MRLQLLNPSAPVAFLLLVIGSSAAPNGTTKSFFPGSSARSSRVIPVDITQSSSDPYVAQGSEFFPSSSSANKNVKFPQSQSNNQNQERFSTNNENVQNVHTATMDNGSSDEAAANEAIDIILRSARSGKSMDLGGGKEGEELVKVASDPIIAEQLANGNEIEARGYIRNKLCGLGLMPCGPEKYHHGGGHHGGGHHGGWAPGIPARDVTLVQPVALKPVGYPIAAVPIGGGHGGGHHGHHGPPPPPIHHHGGYAKQFGGPPKPIYQKPVQLRPSYGPPGGGYQPGPGPIGGGYQPGPPPQLGNKALVEHVHHHIHHTPSTGGVAGVNSGIYGGIVTDEYGLGAKNPISVATPGGSPVNNYPAGQSIPHSNSGFNGDFNSVQDCTCVRINDCAAYDIVGQGTNGQEVIAGFGQPNYGQVGMGIDPRNKVTDVESNATAISSVEEESAESHEDNHARHLMVNIEAEESSEEATTTEPIEEVKNSTRRRRDTKEEKDEIPAASGDGGSEPKKAQGEGRFLGSLLRDNDMLKNLTRFAGYDFGDDPTQLVKIDGQQLRILGKLFGIEPTVGVSFGLPGGYGGAYPLNPVGYPNPVVNPYQDGIPLGPININPLVSFQKGKDKTKTKLFRPLVNLHITPNHKLLKGFKTLFGKGEKKGGGWGAPEYSYAPSIHSGGGYFGGGGGGWGQSAYSYPTLDTSYYGWGQPQVQYYPVEVPVEVPVAVPVPSKVKHHHDHFHYPQKTQQNIYSGQTFGNGWGNNNKGFLSNGGGGGYSSGYANSYYRPSSSYKFDKIGAANNLKTSVADSNKGIISNIFSNVGNGISNLFSPSSSSASGLTANEEVLLQNLLKEEGGSLTQAELDEITNSRDLSRDLLDSGRKRNRPMKFPSQSSYHNSMRFPADTHTRLPPGAFKQNSQLQNTFSSSSQITFPNENESRAATSRVAFPQQNNKRQKRDIITETLTPPAPLPQLTTTKTRTNMNNDNPLPTPPTPDIQERSLNDKRQLNIGGSCPGGYVCCRSPRQQQNQNSFRPGQGTNQVPQVVGNALNYPALGQQQQQQSIGQNPFNQGYGQCGKRNARGITGRVTNPGHIDGDTDYGEYPWQVAILKKDGYDNVYVCGGALIDNRHVLTAAHCIKGHGAKDIRVRLGEWDVNHETEFYPHVERDVSAVNIHPEFYAGNLFNDLAIVTLEGFVDFRQNPHISPVCTPQKGIDFSNQRCFVTGWGKDAFGERGKYQNVLKEVDLPVVANFECEQRLKRTRLGPDFVLHPGFLCAGGEEGKDACKGDGGGPLVCDVGGSWQVAGIVSWGVSCGLAGVPGVYVKVSQYQDWIKQVTNNY